MSLDKLDGFPGPAVGVDGAADDEGVVAAQLADGFHRLRRRLLPSDPQLLGDALGDAPGRSVLLP
jgi:hypothetical protein